MGIHVRHQLHADYAISYRVVNEVTVFGVSINVYPIKRAAYQVVADRVVAALWAAHVDPVASRVRNGVAIDVCPITIKTLIPTQPFDMMLFSTSMPLSPMPT